jgi:hypothetical protein
MFFNPPAFRAEVLIARLTNERAPICKDGITRTKQSAVPVRVFVRAHPTGSDWALIHRAEGRYPGRPSPDR